jgi:hypothetical protein
LKLLTLFAREEPTTDSTLKQYAPNAKRLDTVLYKDPDCSTPYARIPWHHSNRPVRRKSVILNCFKWKVEWLPKVVA